MSLPNLAQRLKELRGEREQQDIARAGGVDPSLISYIESGGSVRPDSLRKVAQGLGASAAQWHELKLLWLEMQFDEPVSTPPFLKARKDLELRDQSKSDSFIAQFTGAVRTNFHAISKNDATQILLRIVKTPKLIASLKQFRDITAAVDPRLWDEN